jgi:hypothetical protein
MEMKPYSHLVRLVLVLLGAMIVFGMLAIAEIPPSWNYDVWFRSDAASDIAALPVIHGDNESCAKCHEDEYGTAATHAHKNLNCEGCHGPLTVHVRNGEKAAEAVGASDWQCLNCHEDKISLPEHHPRFPGDVGKHQNIRQGTMCVKCHDPHDPTLSAEAEEEMSFEL